MGLFDRLDQIVKAADVRTVRPADPQDWPTLSDPLDPTPGETFDLGAVVDDTNLGAAGGYPENVPADLAPFRPEPVNGSPALADDDHECECKGGKALRRVTSLVSMRYEITADDVTSGRALVITPSGADASTITRVTLVASDENAIRYAGDANAAKVGAYLPPWFPITLTLGPVWVVGFLAGATVDVTCEIVE